MRSVCVSVELHVILIYIKISNVSQQCFYGKLHVPVS
jgi:hypothetical protein